MIALTSGLTHIAMKFSARRSSSFRVNRRKVISSESSSTWKPARSSAFTPRVSQPSRGEYDGATTPIVAPFCSAGGRSSGVGANSEPATRASAVSVIRGGRNGEAPIYPPSEEAATENPRPSPEQPVTGLTFGMAAPDPSTYFRKGFGLRAQVQDELAADYSGRLVDRMRADDYALTVGDVTILLA